MGKTRSPAVLYNVEEQNYFTEEGMGATTPVHHNMEVSDSNTTSNPYSNKVSIVRVEEVDCCSAFVGGVTVNKICGLMKRVDGSCNKYYTHAGKKKGDIYSDFYLISNGKNLFLEPLVSLTIGDTNQEFLSQVGEDIAKDTAMDIMDKVNRTAKTSTEGFE